jgi:hypothetical protein
VEGEGDVGTKRIVEERVGEGRGGSESGGRVDDDEERFREPGARRRSNYALYAKLNSRSVPARQVSFVTH